MSCPKPLGGEVLAAPGGDRVDLPGDTHDTIAVYDLTFPQAGTYRAYYRPGDSMAVATASTCPMNLPSDPDMLENHLRIGIFRWETGDTFTISRRTSDVPLEFRIGRREEMAEFDALVLNLDLSMTPEELDALFDVVFDAATSTKTARRCRRSVSPGKRVSAG